MPTSIEFRGWDGESKRFVYWTLNDLLVRFGEPKYQFGVEDRPSLFFDWARYTGVRDTNNNKIFEGDIIVSSIKLGKYKSPVTSANVVTFRKGSFGFVAMSMRWEGEEIFTSLKEALQVRKDEIIGNIYENSYLLTE